MNIVLWGLQSPINIGMILRSAEVFQHSVLIYDEHGAFKPGSDRTTISDFACGALQRRPPVIIDDIDAFLARKGGRIIATSILPDAMPAPRHRWEATDTVLVGNEYDGLPGNAEQRADLRMTIPMPPANLPKPRSHSPIDASRTQAIDKDGMPNLNVAVATSILCFLGYTRPYENRAL